MKISHLYFLTVLFFFPPLLQQLPYRMVVHERTVYGRNGTASLTLNHYLLYHDGRIYKSYVFGQIPRQGARPRQQDAAYWGNWTEQAAGLLINWPEAPGTTETWRQGQYYKVLPGSPNDRLTGTYRLLTGKISNPANPLAGLQTLNFSPDGSFLAGFGSKPDGSSKKQLAGSYRIDGYTIKFVVAGQKPEIFSFYFMPARRGSDAREENSTTLGIGKAYFVKNSPN